MKTFDEHPKEMMEDEEFKKEYDKLTKDEETKVRVLRFLSSNIDSAIHEYAERNEATEEEIYSLIEKTITNKKVVGKSIKTFVSKNKLSQRELIFSMNVDRW